MVDRKIRKRKASISSSSSINFIRMIEPIRIYGGRREKHTKFRSECIIGTDHLEDVV
jgi:hypothetical protein